MNKPLLLGVSFLVALVTMPSVNAQALAGDVQAGSKRIAMCVGCHSIPGYKATFPELYKVPKISGQSAQYIRNALHAYQKGERKHPTMRGIAESLSEQDIADVAAYFSVNGVQSDAQPLPKAPEGPPATMALVVKAACTSCHGDSFSHPLQPDFPKIAGQYPDYVYAALKAYQTDGNALIGRANPIMGGIARQFSHAELRALADYVGSLPSELQTVPENRFK